MKTTKRTFIAIKIQPGKEISELLSTLKNELKTEAIKWVDPDNFHLTLRFLGETDSDQEKSIVRFLEGLGAVRTPFQMQVKGAGIFGGYKNPRVIFLQVAENEVLKILASEIENYSVSLGFQKSEHRYNPHLTLGRIKFIQSKRQLFTITEKYANKDLQLIEVDKLIFYESILKAEGPVYKPLSMVNLKKI